MKPLLVPFLLIAGTLFTGCATTGSYTGNNRSGDLYYSLEDVRSKKSTYVEEVKGEDFAESNTQGIQNYPGTKPPATQNENSENRVIEDYSNTTSPSNSENYGGETFNTQSYNNQNYNNQNYNGNNYQEGYNDQYYDPYYSNSLNSMGRPRMSMSYYDPYNNSGYGAGPQLGFSVGYSNGYSGLSYSNNYNPYGYGSSFDPFYDSFSCFRGPYWRNPYYYYYAPNFAYYSPYYGGYYGGYGSGYYRQNHHNYYDYGYKKEAKRYDKNTQYGPRDTKAPSKSGYERPYQYQKNDTPNESPKPNSSRSYEQEKDSRREKIERAREPNNPSQPKVEPRRTPKENQRTSPRKKSSPRANLSENNSPSRFASQTPNRVKKINSRSINNDLKPVSTNNTSNYRRKVEKSSSKSSVKSNKASETKPTKSPRKRKR
ncbi:MAG: hypothetical protein ACJATA_000193 [Sphingobacteriales bacterium]|jgi:hypothetical protein